MLNWPRQKWEAVLKSNISPLRGLPVLWCGQSHPGGVILFVIEEVVNQPPNQVMIAESIRSARLVALSAREFHHLLGTHGIRLE
jgi:hypothetical protein